MPDLDAHVHGGPREDYADSNVTTVDLIKSPTEGGQLRPWPHSDLQTNWARFSSGNFYVVSRMAPNVVSTTEPSKR